jgi:hypothetical protein
VTATPNGKELWIVPTTILLAVSITETVPERGLVTKTFVPSWLTATPNGTEFTRIVGRVDYRNRVVVLISDIDLAPIRVTATP